MSAANDFRPGDTENTLLRKLLAAFRETAGLLDIPENSFRFGDGYNQLLHKLVHVVRQGAALPNDANHEWRQGDSDYALLHKLLGNLNTGIPNSAQMACRCGDSAYDLLRKILHVVRSKSALPSDPVWEWRPGDSEYAIWRKILRDLRTLLDSGFEFPFTSATPVSPSGCCPPPIGDWGFVIDPVTLSCDFGSVIQVVNCFEDWGSV